MREDEKQGMILPLEDRIKRARAANLALYLDEPTPEAARFLYLFEQVVVKLREQEKQRGKAGA
jgi:hypothetical protein